MVSEDAEDGGAVVAELPDELLETQQVPGFGRGVLEDVARHDDEFALLFECDGGDLVERGFLVSEAAAGAEVAAVREVGARAKLEVRSKEDVHSASAFRNARTAALFPLRP